MGAAVEVIGLLTVLAASAWLVLAGAMGLTSCIWITLLLLCGLLYLTWKRFNGGRHPCFLFMAMLLIFQGGRLFGFAAGLVKEPMQIAVTTFSPISVPTSVAEMTLLVIVLSAILIYAPCRLRPRYEGFWSGDTRRWMPALYALILLTLPFALYKNLAYLAYIRAHGGYLAVFTDNDAVLKSAGFLARTVSTINETAILTAFVLEWRKGRRRLIVALFFLMAALDLVIGFRGKFFAEVVSLWFISNLRSGKRFRVVPLVVTSVIASVGAVLIAGFRENKGVALLSPLGFLATQGVSMNVTEAAVAWHHMFSPYGWSYLWNGFINGVTPIAQGPGKLWTWDLTVFLNPLAAEHGFGTASSYLAELYLFAGLPAVILGSLAIGCCLNWMHRASSRLWGALVLAFVLPAVIYLPRLELLAPLAVLVKSMVSLGVVALFVLSYRAATAYVRLAVLGKPKDPPVVAGATGTSAA